jgi:hypothetical protein
VCFYIIYASAKTNVEHVGFLHVWRQSRYKAHDSLGLVDGDPGLIIATNPITWCHHAAQILRRRKHKLMGICHRSIPAV